MKDQLQPGMKALDVGSGSGILTVYMALMVGNAGSVVGIGKTKEGVVLTRNCDLTRSAVARRCGGVRFESRLNTAL